MNIVCRLSTLHKLEIDHPIETGFAASHFFELHAKSDFQQLNIDIMSRILTHPELKIIDEDSLCHFIVQRISIDQDDFKLLEYVRFEYVSVSMMTELINIISNSFDMFTFAVWNRIARRLLLPIHLETINDRSFLEFFDGRDPLDGIIAHLTRFCGGNVSDKNIVKITPSSTGHGDCKTLANFGVISDFYTKNSPGSWVCYDFERMKVMITSYSIRSRSPTTTLFPRHWILEGSSDGQDWVEIDRRDNDLSLNQMNPIVHFGCVTTNSRAMKMIRFRLTGKDSLGSHYLCISGLELFGSLFLSDK
jgi:hypothetical protein